MKNKILIANLTFLLFIFNVTTSFYCRVKGVLEMIPYWK